MCQEIAHAAACEYADETRNHKTVIQDILTDARRSRPVKTDAGQIRRISWQEEIAITGRNKGQNQYRIHACIQRHRHNDGNRRSLGINELGRQEGYDCISPWILGYRSAKELLQNMRLHYFVWVEKPSAN